MYGEETIGHSSATTDGWGADYALTRAANEEAERNWKPTYSGGLPADSKTPFDYDIWKAAGAPRSSAISSDVYTRYNQDMRQESVTAYTQQQQRYVNLFKEMFGNNTKTPSSTPVAPSARVPTVQDVTSATAAVQQQLPKFNQMLQRRPVIDGTFGNIAVPQTDSSLKIATGVPGRGLI